MVELILDNLNIKYDDFHAVRGVSLKILDSEIVTLLGPSGCGKTSILRAVAGFTKPSEGKIYVDGNDITDLPPQQRDMGMIFQNYALWPHMNIEGNIAYGLKLRKVPREERKKKVKEMLNSVQLGDQEQKFPAQLSGGQQQRVALARALVINPKILLCDEPLSNLDFKLRVELRNEIRDVAKEVGVTVVYVTHDQTEALAISDKVAIIDEGLLIQEDSPINIFSDPNSLFVANFVGENNSFRGKVESIDKSISIKLKSGEVLKTNVPPDNIKIGTELDIVTRYDGLEFEPQDVSNKISGKIKHLAFMGEFIQIEVLLSDSSNLVINVRDKLEEYTKLSIGSEVSIQIPPDSMFLFKNKSRLR